MTLLRGKHVSTRYRAYPELDEALGINLTTDEVRTKLKTFIADGHNAKQEICRFVDYIITTWNTGLERNEHREQDEQQEEQKQDMDVDNGDNGDINQPKTNEQLRAQFEHLPNLVDDECDINYAKTAIDPNKRVYAKNQIHPSATDFIPFTGTGLQEFAKWDDERTRLHERLVNGLQGPHDCTKGYCLRKRKADGVKVCKKKFPHDFQVRTDVKFEPHGRNAQGEIFYRTVIKTRRNDQLINPFIPVMLDYWRANLDFQIVMPLRVQNTLPNTQPKLKLQVNKA